MWMKCVTALCLHHFAWTRSGKNCCYRNTHRFINHTISTIIKRRTLSNVNSLSVELLLSGSRRASWRYCENATESRLKWEGRGCKPHTETDENRVSSQAIFVRSTLVRKCHHTHNRQPLACPAPHKHCQILKALSSTPCCIINTLLTSVHGHPSRSHERTRSARLWCSHEGVGTT